MSETPRRRRFQGLTASLSMLTMLGALAGAMFLNGDGGGGDGGEGGSGGDAGGQGAGNGEASGASGQGAGDGGSGGEGAGDKATKVEFTDDQKAHIAKLIGEEKAKAEEKGRKAAEAAAAEATKRAKMDEADRLKAEKDDAEKAANEATARANARLIRADAKVAAVGAGVKADRVEAFLRVADLSDVKVNDDGEPDGKAIAKVVSSTLADFPEFKAPKGTGGASGGEHNGNGQPVKPTTLEEAVRAKVSSQRG